jgi:DNA-binding NarL/FixJ family response regulator
MTKIRVALVDDHTVVREGFKALLNLSDSIEVVSEAQDGVAALENISFGNIDILISDVYMPNMNGIDLCVELHKQNNNIPVLLLSMYNNKEYFIKAIKCGASGYLLKDCEKEELFMAIRKVAQGEKYFGNVIGNALVDSLVGNQLSDKNLDNVLTLREKDILTLAIEGLSTKLIAERLFISPRTVDKHRSNIMQKFNVHNIVELINYVRVNKIL